MLGRMRLAATAVLTAAALIVLVPFHLAGMAIGGRAAGALTVPWHRFALKLMGVRVTVTGTPDAGRPLLLLSNHVSWLDIPVLASLGPVSFVAKKEVATWPLFGWLARLQRSVFVDRERRRATGDQADELAGRLSAGDIVVLFAEGTSSDGNRVLPFRSALVGAAQRAAGGGEAAVQPVAIAYPRMLGLPIGRRHRPRIAWYGGMDLLPHLGNVLSLGGIDVHVVFGPAWRLGPGTDRKRVTAAAGDFARRTVAALNAGYPPEVAAELNGGAPSRDAAFQLHG
jgi:1-acyl-sn-glycerol-3-phosphate acyltransferase